MRLIITGLPRSGTSVLMRAVRAGGMPLFYDEDLERRFRNAFPSANPEGFFELREEAMIRGGIPDNHAAKIFPAFVRWLPVDVSYHVVVINRNAAAREASYRRVFAQGHDKAIAGRLQMFPRNLEECLAYMRSRAEFSVLHMHLEDIVAKPLHGMEQLARFLPESVLDVARAAAVFRGDPGSHAPDSRIRQGGLSGVLPKESSRFVGDRS